MSTPIIVPVYACTVVIVDDRYPGGPRTTESRDCSLEPFELGESTFAGGHCRAVRSGGPGPAYRLEVSGGGETFRTERGVLLVRFPGKASGRWEVADAHTLLIMASQRDRVRSLGVYPDGPAAAPVPAQGHVCRPERSQLVVEFGPAPTGPPVKRTQQSLFDLEDAG